MNIEFIEDFKNKTLKSVSNEDFAIEHKDRDDLPFLEIYSRSAAQREELGLYELDNKFINKIIFLAIKEAIIHRNRKILDRFTRVKSDENRTSIQKVEVIKQSKANSQQNELNLGSSIPDTIFLKFTNQVNHIDNVKELELEYISSEDLKKAAEGLLSIFDIENFEHFICIKDVNAFPQVDLLDNNISPIPNMAFLGYN